MKVQFKGTVVLPTYQAMGTDNRIYNFTSDGEYDLDDVVAKRFIEKRPEMFTDKIPVKVATKIPEPEVVVEKKPEPKPDVEIEEVVKMKPKSTSTLTVTASDIPVGRKFGLEKKPVTEKPKKKVVVRRKKVKNG